jgi:hypothetical protein
MWWIIALTGLGIAGIAFLIQTYRIAFVERNDS